MIRISSSIKILLLILALVCVGCTNEENTTINSIGNDSVDVVLDKTALNNDNIFQDKKIVGKINLPEEISSDVFTVHKVNFEDLMLKFKEIYSTKENFFAYDLESDSVYYTINEGKNYYDSFYINSLKSGSIVEARLNKNYTYIDTFKIYKGTFYGIFSNLDEEFEKIIIKATGEIFRKNLGRQSRISASTYGDGFVITRTIEERETSPIKYEQKVGIIGFDDNDLVVINDESGILEYNEMGEPIVLDGMISSIGRASDEGVGYQLNNNFQWNSPDKYNMKKTYWMNLKKSETFEIIGFNDLAHFFAGDGEYFLGVVTPDKAPSLNLLDQQNGYLFLKDKESENYTKYAIPGYSPVYAINEVYRLNEDNLIVVSGYYTDIINMKTKNIYRVDFNYRNINSYSGRFLDFNEGEIAFLYKSNESGEYVVYKGDFPGYEHVK